MSAENVAEQFDVEPTDEEVLDVLRDSHSQLSGALMSLDGDQVSAPSYDDDWSLAQVASHLGSSAEIFALYLESGRAGTEPPSNDVFKPIWDGWNAKSPNEQVRDAVAADAAFIERVASFTDDERARWQLNLFGRDVDLSGILRMRLAEHALHTWDIVVMGDPSATVNSRAVPSILDGLWWLLGYVAKPISDQTIRVVTTAPARALVLKLAEGGESSLSAAEGAEVDAAAELRLPAEAFVRLVYGRLDPDHTPASVEASGVELDYLRQVFPGV
jgi:uncharacterized protein (TIGR03083 family)